ncbi:head-tail connector protein [Paraburkholderia silvatlantica]|uniref:head-tail connector protein n=1 Tax=Paraburkholderia silvatlantica TaxID=321895 RepID=UPI0037509504
MSTPNQPAARTSIITLDQAKQWIRVDGDAMDPNIELAIAGASASVLAYLKRDPYADGEAVPAQVVQATALLTGMFIRDPDMADVQSWLAGYPPAPIVSLLYPLRDPALS